MFWGTIGGRGAPSTVIPPATGADFGSSLSSDFSTGFVTIYDATVQLIGTDNGSSIGPSGTANASFGQANATQPRFTGDQVSVASGLSFSAGAEATTAQFLLAQTFSATYANGYLLAFFAGGVNYRVLVSASAWLSTAPTFSNQARLAFRWGSVKGVAFTTGAGGVTTWTDAANPVGSDESGLTIPTTAHYAATTSMLAFLEKVAIIP